MLLENQIDFNASVLAISLFVAKYIFCQCFTDKNVNTNIHCSMKSVSVKK